MKQRQIWTKIFKTLSPMMLLFVATFANANLIINGDFESGDQDFITDYVLGIGVADQRYNVTTDPHLHHSGAASYGDHTSGSGLMMAVNAATDANQLVWGQSISLNSNTDYEFSIWVSSWTSTYPANLIFDIGGISLGSFIAPSTTALWDQYSISFNSGVISGPALLSIIDTTRAFGGDDFALDDISLIVLTTPNGIPEPSTLLLLGIGLIGIVYRRFKVA